MAEYGSSDSGASLGDILGAALRSREQEATPDDDAPAEAAEAAEEATEEPKEEAAEDTPVEEAEGDDTKK